MIHQDKSLWIIRMIHQDKSSLRFVMMNHDASIFMNHDDTP